MKILITGSSGFLGSALVKYLLDRNHEVVGFSSTQSSLKHDHLKNVVGDIRNREDLIPAVNDVDFIYHLAGWANPAECLKNPEGAMSINSLGTKVLLDVIRDFSPSISGLVFASTTKVYGRPKTEVVNEHAECIPYDPYAVSKLNAERHCSNSNLDCIIMRQTNVYGPNQSVSYAIPYLIQQATRSNQILLKNAGASADFIYLSDMLEAYGKVLKAPSKGTYNVCSGVTIRLEEVVSIVSEILEKDLHVTSEFYDKTPSPCFDGKKFSIRFDWKPRVDIKTGLTKTVRAFEANLVN